MNGRESLGQGIVFNASDFILENLLKPDVYLKTCHASMMVLFCKNIHCTKNKNFPLRNSSVNVTKSAGDFGFGHIYWKNPSWETSFFCSVVNTPRSFLKVNFIRRYHLMFWLRYLELSGLVVNLCCWILRSNISLAVNTYDTWSFSISIKKAPIIDK